MTRAELRERLLAAVEDYVERVLSTPDDQDVDVKPAEVADRCIALFDEYAEQELSLAPSVAEVPGPARNEVPGALAWQGRAGRRI